MSVPKSGNCKRDSTAWSQVCRNATTCVTCSAGTSEKKWSVAPSRSHESVSDDEREVAVLFVDLVGSTQLATTREPHEVAAVLNDFFQIVVNEVDARNGSDQQVSG